MMDVSSGNPEVKMAESGPSIPERPNFVESAALLEEPRLTPSQRHALRRVLSDTARLVKKQDAAEDSRPRAAWA